MGTDSEILGDKEIYRGEKKEIYRGGGKRFIGGEKIYIGGHVDIGAVRET